MAVEAKRDTEQDPKKGQRHEMRMIARAASILRALADQPAGMSFGQIAKATGLARSTVQRLVGAMEVERLVATEAESIGVRIGSEIQRVAASAHRDVKRLMHAKIEHLHHEVEDTVDLTLLQGNTAVVIDQMQGAGRQLRVVSQIGSALPLHCTSNGKAHLSQMSDGDLSQILAAVMREPRTKNTIMAIDKLQAQIRKIRAGGFAEDIEEFMEGVCAVSLPLRGFRSGNYALGVLLPRQRYEGREEFVRKALLRCQAAIEEMSGH